MNAILDALGVVGDTLAAPGDYVRGALAGRMGERMDGRAFLRSQGLAGEEDTWGNLATGTLASIATDPLSYLPVGWLARNAVGSVGSALGKAGKRFLASEAGSVPATNSLSAMRRAREGFPMLHNIDDAGNAAYVAGAKGTNYTTADLARQSKSLARDTAASLARDPDAVNVGGFFPNRLRGPLGYTSGLALPEEMATGVGTRMVPATGRHETVHGLIDQVARGKDGDGLPLLIRGAGLLGRDAQPGTFRSGLSQLVNEAAAQASEVPGQGAQNLGRFLFGMEPPVRDVYAKLFAQESPLVGAIYRNLPQAARVAAAGTGALALGGAGYGAYNYLNQPGER